MNASEKSALSTYMAKPHVTAAGVVLFRPGSIDPRLGLGADKSKILGYLLGHTM